MAQRKTRTLSTRLRVLARRYGLTTTGRVAAVAVLLVLATASVGAVGLVRDGGITIERAGAAEQPTEAQGGATQADESQGGATSDVQPQDAQPQDGQSRGDASQTSAADASGAQPTRLLVHVDGAVASPGVYVLEEEDPRMNDAVMHAGGLTPEADTSGVNLAAPVADGQKVHIPAVGEEPPQVEASPAGADPAVAPVAEGSPAPAAAQADGLVNVNTASEQELCQLPGVGEATASAIVRERDANGPFASVEDIMRVSGIGEKKFAKMRDLICV